jgi:glutathione synthase/RimK-type ligase-like ATP-grasp enzyme
MRQQHVLLLGDDDDAHLSAVRDYLHSQDIDPLIVGVGSNFGLVAAKLDPAGEPELYLGGRTLAGESITSVWDRSRSSVPILTDENWQYAFRERKAFLESIYAIAPQARWMNPLHGAVTANNKLGQLLAARRAGLAIPATYVTNDAQQVSQWHGGEEDPLIFKALTWLATTDGRVLFTTEIDAAKLAACGDALKAAPCIFQERIQKEYELRVTCILDDTYAVKLHSQDQPITTLDWRRDQENLEYAPYNVPSKLQGALRAIMRDLGLVFGAFDLAYVDGQYVFFEVNPSGNWLWLEEELHLPIAARIGQWLISG